MAVSFEVACFLFICYGSNLVVPMWLEPNKIQTLVKSVKPLQSKRFQHGLAGGHIECFESVRLRRHYTATLHPNLYTLYTL